jgi:hypothetical protein
MAAHGPKLLVAAPTDDARFAQAWSEKGLRREAVPFYDPRSTGGAVYAYDLR